MRVKSILVLLAVLLVLGGYYYYLTHRPTPTPPEQPKIYVWSIEMEQIEHITLSLPKEGKSQSFIKISQEDKFPWFFDDANHSPVDTNRWGGGIPLLLSGPGADRIIAENATEEKITEYGLTQPNLDISLSLTGGDTMEIKVGNKTPNGINYYVQVPGRNDVCTVDVSWYDVLSKLVTDPPYTTAATK